MQIAFPNGTAYGAPIVTILAEGIAVSFNDVVVETNESKNSQKAEQPKVKSSKTRNKSGKAP